MILSPYHFSLLDQNIPLSTLFSNFILFEFCDFHGLGYKVYSLPGYEAK